GGVGAQLPRGERWPREIDAPRIVLEAAGDARGIFGVEAGHLDERLRSGDLRGEALRLEMEDEARRRDHLLGRDRLAARGGVALGAIGEVRARALGEEIERGLGV